MKITILTKDRAVTLPADLIKRICNLMTAGEKQRFDELTLHFVTKEEIAELHDLYFDDPTPTDCITFPMDGPEEKYRVLGDVFICPTVAVDYARKNKLDPVQECALYVVHGLLHLFGYDDIKESDRRIMKTAETRYMEILFP